MPTSLAYTDARLPARAGAGALTPAHAGPTRPRQYEDRTGFLFFFRYNKINSVHTHQPHPLHFDFNPDLKLVPFALSQTRHTRPGRLPAGCKAQRGGAVCLSFRQPRPRPGGHEAAFLTRFIQARRQVEPHSLLGRWSVSVVSRRDSSRTSSISLDTT
ncbi:hypothetical protein GALMADRAFT_145342 [Galerina marginata CBS 339.88]|uniref:Uncharacterized protein n=1 Tax=Galerina marginata (strain CBS 339.88) TaxID=685588 RepID=A0A067SS59_GALM3|nr:hypothetical protein GALMADRAFT_145342 [Galerina marginata CBS 339.88]